MSGSFCPNCGEPSSSAYCTHCGQRQTSLDRPLISLMPDIWDWLRPWDAKIISTLSVLMLRPGLYAHDWLNGRQVRHTSPFKLFASLVIVFAALLKFTDFRLIQINVLEPISFARGVKPEYSCAFPDMQCRAVGGTGVFGLRFFDIQRPGSIAGDFQLPMLESSSAAAELTGDEKIEAGISETISRIARESSFVNTGFAGVLSQLLTFSLPATFFTLLLLFIGKWRNVVSHAVNAVAIQCAIYGVAIVALSTVWISRGAIHGLPVLLAISAALIIYLYGYFRFDDNFGRQRAALSSIGFLIIATVLMALIFASVMEVTSLIGEGMGDAEASS